MVKKQQVFSLLTPTLIEKVCNCCLVVDLFVMCGLIRYCRVQHVLKEHVAALY